MTFSSGTPNKMRTRFGKLSDYEGAQNELDNDEIGELVADVSDYQNTPYEEAQEIARAFYNNDSIKYDKNQLEIRETAKEKVDKHSQPDWAWKLLSVHSDDLGKKLLDIPSDGASKGLLVDENFEKAFLYAKEDGGISETDHVRRWYDNGMNASSVGYELPSQDIERIALDIGQEEYGVPVLAMDYNSDMVLDSKIEDTQINEENEIQDRNNWVEDSQPNREAFLEEQNVPNVEEWTTGLEFLIDNNFIENWGAIEYKRGKDNTAIDPKSKERIMVDLGEYRIEDEDEDTEIETSITSSTPDRLY